MPELNHQPDVVIIGSGGAGRAMLAGALLSLDKAVQVQVVDAPGAELSLQRHRANMPNVIKQLPVTVGPQPLKRGGPKPSRNAPCFCGSGKKHKRCCLPH